METKISRYDRENAWVVEPSNETFNTLVNMAISDVFKDGGTPRDF